MAAVDRSYGSKQIHQRLSSSHAASASASASASNNKVCFQWRAGRCNRHPCPFLHIDIDAGDAPTTKPPRAHHHKNVGWRNPNSANGGKASSSSKVVVCKFFLAGKICPFGERCKFLHKFFVGDDSFALLTCLQAEGQGKVITGISLPSGSNRLYSGSQYQTVRVWDCETGQCVGTVNLEGQVGCLISEGSWMFVGIPNGVKAWNTQTSTDVSLDTGPNAGQVYTLAVANADDNEMLLFAGVQDGRILAWKRFAPAAALAGHQSAVVSLVIGAGRLYSGSMDTTIRVWDLATLQCIESLAAHTDVVMSLLCWDQFLFSASLDGTIKVWAATESESISTGNNLLQVTYPHNEEDGVLKLCGMPDAQGKPVLLCACNDNTLRLYDLPSFSERGKIFAKEEVRSMEIGPGGLFFTGDAAGEFKVWRWLPAANEAVSAAGHI